MGISVKLANVDLTKLPDVIEATNKRVAENERRSFGRTVANWENKPTFNRVVTKSYFGVQDFAIETDSDIYKWVDEGTELHEITPNGPYKLKIRGGSAGYGNSYNAKTNAGKLTSDGSGTYNGPPTYSSSVMQSIEPRNFTEKIVEKASDRWERALQTEIDKYLKANVK